jgi:hypothetical protein
MERFRIPFALFAMSFALWTLFGVFQDSRTNAQPSLQQGLTAEEQDAGYGEFEPVKVRDGALSWDLFAAVKEIERQEPDPEDPQFSRYWVEPRFTKEMRALDGQTVRLMGYMFPLDPTEEQSKFLFGPYPPTCGFHYHVNANQVLEVSAKSPITFSWEPVAIEGTLHLIEKDENSVFYRVKGAILKKEY